LKREQRRTPRFTFIASAELIEQKTEVRIATRVSELSLHGCYLDMMNPFPQDTLVLVKIFAGEDFFHAKAKIIYVQAKSWLWRLLPRSRTTGSGRPRTLARYGPTRRPKAFRLILPAASLSPSYQVLIKPFTWLRAPRPKTSLNGCVIVGSQWEVLCDCRAVSTACFELSRRPLRVPT